MKIETLEQLGAVPAEMVAAFWSLETAPTPEAGMANALAVIGVSVDE